MNSDRTSQTGSSGARCGVGSPTTPPSPFPMARGLAQRVIMEIQERFLAFFRSPAGFVGPGRGRLSRDKASKRGDPFPGRDAEPTPDHRRES